MPILFLVLAHLFARAGFRVLIRRGSIVLAGVCLGGHIAAPWLVRYAGSGWALFMLLTLAALMIGMGVMLLGSIWAMWRPQLSRWGGK